MSWTSDCIRLRTSEVTKLSVLSSMKAMRGRFPWSTRREKVGGNVHHGPHKSGAQIRLGIGD